MTSAITKIDASNSLADLAARIKAEHEAVSTALKESVRHNVAEWLGEEGDKFRKRCGIPAVSAEFKAAWAVFLAEHRKRSLEDVIDELERLQRECSRAPHRKRPGRTLFAPK
jgi:hypothetical protein